MNETHGPVYPGSAQQQLWTFETSDALGGMRTRAHTLATERARDHSARRHDHPRCLPTREPAEPMQENKQRKRPREDGDVATTRKNCLIGEILSPLEELVIVR